MSVFRILCNRSNNMHRFHQIIRITKSRSACVCVVPKKAATRFRPDGESRAVALPWQACLRITRVPSPSLPINQHRLVRLCRLCLSRLSRLGVAQPMLGLAQVLKSLWKVCLLAGCVLSVKSEQPPWLCNLLIRCAMLRFAAVYRCGHYEYNRLIVICSMFVKTSAPFTSSACARSNLLYRKTQSSIAITE